MQFSTIISGFILPYAILQIYGSEINGLVSSISQFLGYIVILESGVGSVTRAALYSPLVDNDKRKISGILKATEIFFRKIAYIFLIYTMILAVVYPHIIRSQNDIIFISSLVLVISIHTFVQYYFGMTYSVFLQADQRNYISNLIQCITVLINAVISVILIYTGFGIHIVKMITCIIFVSRPILLSIYVKKIYNLDLKCVPENNAIKDRWSGLGQHIAYFLHSNTDIVVLTLFANIKEVSVYSVYSLITAGVRNLAMTVSNGLEGGFGNLIAKKDKKKLQEIFSIYETLISMVTITMFMTAAKLMIPFVNIYTKGVNDINYIRPLVANLMIASEIIYCLRLPYNTITLAAGHFRQIQKIAFWEAGINIALSVCLVKKFGIPGILFATIVSMLVRLIHFGFYLSRNILKNDICIFLKRQIYNIFIIFVISIVNCLIIIPKLNTYLSLGIYGFIIIIIDGFVSLILSFFAYRFEVLNLIKKIMSLKKK